MTDEPVCFEDWEAILRTTVPLDRQRGYREAIVKFRYWLREKGKEPVPGTFKEHLAWKQSYLPPERFTVRQEALRWYYKTGLQRMQDRAVADGKTEAARIETPGDVFRDAARFGKAAQTNAPDMQANPESRPTAAPTVSTPDAHDAGAKRGSPSGRKSARIPWGGDYRVYGMNDVPTAGAKNLGGPPWGRGQSVHMCKRSRSRFLSGSDV